jgi:hypothetical protein
MGSHPVELLMTTHQMSEVVGVRLADGRRVVVKARPDPQKRAATCVALQRIAADRGFPCARPLTDVSFTDGRAIHAEEWRPEGEMLRGDDPSVAERSAHLYRELMALIEGIALPPPLPNPEWVQWDHDGPGLWAPNARHDAQSARVRLPEELVDIAARARHRLLLGSGLPRVLGHADWEAQNLRWRGDAPYTVYDWDSLAWLPEAALVGAASGSFASAETPTLAPLPSSEAFLSRYERDRGRRFNTGEREIAWAAILWPALHNARGEVLYDAPRVAYAALMAQSERRLRLAGA